MPGPLHQLPPLILHPFSDAAGSIEVLESAKAAAQLMLDDARPPSQAEQLRERLLAGRYAELRMLFFVGKDVSRWLDQCQDFAERTPDLRDRGLLPQSFAEFLIGQAPQEVQGKLRNWGVTDYSRIFARAIAINAQFQEPPERDLFNPDYLSAYYRYADFAYICWKESAQFPPLTAAEFTFTLYASGEYSKFLEEQWR